MLGDARKHLGTDLVTIVEREHVIRPSVPREGFVGAGLALQAPADAEEGGEHPPGAGGRPAATNGRGYPTELGGAEGNADEIGAGLTVLEAVG